MPLGSWYSQLPAFGWFDPEDRPGSNALGVPDSRQGIALPSRRGLGKWFNVTPPGSDRPFPLQQTDTGPAPWTGRGVDISAAGARQMGYTPKNFPTDANFKVEPIDLTGLGLAASYMGGVPGDNQTAVAQGPPQGRKMPESLMDMFQPQDISGKPIGFDQALRQNSGSLIGLGLGMLQPHSLAVGAPVGNAWTGALEGYQQGAAQDTRRNYAQAQLAHQKTQEARQAAMDRFNMGLREREFAQSQLTPYQKMQADLERAKGTPNEQQVADFYRTQLDAGPPQTREVFDPQLGRNVIQEWDSRSKSYKTATTGGGSTATATNAQGQPVLPAKKPLSAHEQTAIDTADNALMANQQVLGTLQDAKRLSANAFSGLMPLQRAEVGAQIPDYLPGMKSNQTAQNTLLLHNKVISQAVDQLKATFGGNPSEGERKILLDLAGSLNSPDSVRQKIYDDAIEYAQKRIEKNRRQAEGIRAGTYYNPGGGMPTTPTAGAVERKTIGGKSYSKRDGQWFED